MHRDEIDQLLAKAAAARKAGDLKASFDALVRAACDLGDPVAGSRLTWMLMHMKASTTHPDVDRAWLKALTVPWERSARLAPGVLRYLELDPAVAQALAAPSDAALLDRAVQRLVARPLFQSLATQAIITDPRWQALLAAWRAQAFARWSVAGFGWSIGLGWLALQANLCDYVWPVAEDTEVLRRAGGADATRLLACFEHPGAAAQAQFEEADALLVQRLYAEPAQEQLYRDELVRNAVAALPETAVREQYERFPYPRWIVEPMFAHAWPEPVQALMARPRPGVLLAGCGTGLQCVAARATYPDADITAIDFSLASLGYAVRKCRELGLHGIAFECADLLAYPVRGRRFDLIECMGVLHHIPDLQRGAAALRELANEGALLRLAVYSPHARQWVYQQRKRIEQEGIGHSLESLRNFRSELLGSELPPALLQSPDLHCASGLHDLLFNACEHVLGARAWVELMAQHGFNLVCLDAPAPVLSAAGPAAAAWGVAEWEAFEQSHPFAFAGMYEFWFVARD